ncbi:MAG: TonB-dependent receptor [Rubrivivax sp.]|nr:TonB-dependent receptor [Rubrivivax sp.]
MFKKTKVGVAAAMLVSGVGLLAGAAQAQGTDQRVEITGSRILSIGAQSPAPVQVLTSEDIAKSGVANVQELLLKLPAMGTPTLSRTNSNFLTSSAGVATIDLRNLSEDRTLVLVNGRRFIAGIPGSAAVDLNTIPTDFIERVEIFTGGASATYGSDAMAGVVNIILKKNFTGAIIDAQVGESEERDDKKQKLSLTAGLTSADGRSHLMAHFGYSRQDAVYSNRRPGGETDNIPAAFLTGDPAQMFEFVTPFFSSFAPQGRFFVGPAPACTRPGQAVQTSCTFDRQGNLIPVATNGAPGFAATGFNRQEFRTIAVPVERFLFATKGETAVADNLSIFFEGTYAQTQTRSRLEPFPLDSADTLGSGIYPGQGVPAEFRVGGAILANPLIPPALLALMTDTDGDGLRDYTFTRRLAEVGTRGNVADRDTFRYLGGLKGTLLNAWDYEVFVAYGATKETQVSSGQVNVLTFRSALEAVPDVTDVDNDGDTSEVICLDPIARFQGCVPVNVFGFNSITPAALRYITAPTLLSTFTSQKLTGGVIRGEPLKLPAGPVAMAAGYEARAEYSRSEFDPLAQAGLNAGNAIPRTEGSFNVKELFGEVRVPLLKDMPAVKSLTFNAALRGADYSTVGSVSSWNAGLEWAPISDLRFRLTRALSTRAPNINELYSPPSQDFPQIVDPCDGITPADAGTTLGDRCLAAVGVAANIAANAGTFTLNQADLQGTSQFQRGNPNLTEEVGRSWTAGFVWTPSSLRNFSLEVDYYKIDIQDAIQFYPDQFILNQCYTGDASFCRFVVRRPNDVGGNSAGSIGFVNNEQANTGGFLSEGIDLTLNYAGVIGPGRLNTRLTWTHLLDDWIRPTPTSEKDFRKGEVGVAKDKFALTTGYTMGPFGVTGTLTYIAKSDIDDQLVVGGFGGQAGSLSVPAKTYLDLQFNYTLGKTMLYLGIDNALGTKPPQFDTNGLITGGTTGAGTAADVYDAIGRRYYVGMRLSL